MVPTPVGSRLSLLGQRQKPWLITALYVLALAALAQLGYAQVFDAPAQSACTNIRASLTSTNLILAVGFVLFLVAVWQFVVRRSEAVPGIINTVLITTVLLSGVAVAGWFGLRC